MTSSAVRLPRLPIPALEETCERFVATVAPLLTPDELRETRSIVAEFAKKEGPELQRAVVMYDQGAAAASGSYIEKWWDDAYLVPRDPIAINVNPFFMLQDDPASAKNEQLVRTSSLVAAMLKFWLRIKNHQLEPDEERGKPLCMYQYERIVAGVRYPQLSRDVCRNFPDSRHIVVLYRNHVAAFNVLGENNEPLSEVDIQLNLQDIVQRLRHLPPGVPIGALTTENRTRWALVRALMETNDTNRRSLETIDSALFVVCLDDSTTDDMDALAALMLHGDGRSRWFDKSLQLIVTAHGHAGINMEHAAFDGHTLLRLATEVYMDSVRGTSQAKITRFLERSPPRVLEWSVSETVARAVREAEQAVDKLIAANEARVLVVHDFGKTAIQQLRVSPDAFVQMSYQLAHYRMHNSFACTYESAMTKQFQHGRTEALRSVTPQAVAFARAAAAFNADTVQAGAVPSNAAELRVLLEQACAAHVRRMEECKSGRGVDRHLLAMRKLAAELDMSPALFRCKAYTEVLTQSVLSTSNCGSTALSLFGFGPVVPHGYGIGYIIKDTSMHFVVTSQHRGTGTMAAHIARALRDMKTLLEITAPAAAPAARTAAATTGAATAATAAASVPRARL